MAMKAVYKKLWEMAKPYYLKGRPMDIAHIEWMMKDALLVCKKEGIDESLLLPLVILHDVGYSAVPTGNPYNLDLRRAHMEAGAKIARLILENISYPKEKTDRIAHYVSVHDNWAFGETKIYLEDIVLGTLSDFDFVWMATKEGFSALMKIHGKSPAEMIEYLEKNDKLTTRPFRTETAKGLFENYLGERKKEYKPVTQIPPDIIKEVGFDFDWKEEKVWALDVPVEEMDIIELVWHIEIPFWHTSNGHYDLTPIQVLAEPEKYSEEYNRTMKADLSHPLDIMLNKGRWLLLDGLHRLVKARVLKQKTVKVRKIPREMIERIVP